MKQCTIEATVPENKEKKVKEMKASLVVNFPDFEGEKLEESLKEAVAAFGIKAILSNAFANWRVTLQSNVRNALKRGESQEQIQARLGSAKMGVATAAVAVDAKAVFMAQFQNATPEDQAKLIADLKARAAKKSAA